MSNRTIVELNHDYSPRPEKLQEWAEAIRAYLRSGDKSFLPQGVMFISMRHHSDPSSIQTARELAISRLSVKYQEEGKWRINYTMPNGSVIAVVNRHSAEMAIAQIVGIVADIAESSPATSQRDKTHDCVHGLFDDLCTNLDCPNNVKHGRQPIVVIGDTAKVSRTYGELPESVRNLIEPHEWDNKNITEQRDWALSILAEIQDADYALNVDRAWKKQKKDVRNETIRNILKAFKLWDNEWLKSDEDSFQVFVESKLYSMLTEEAK